MSNLKGLFGKASAVSQASESPTPAPPSAAKPAAFKIGGGAPNPPSAPAVVPQESVAPLQPPPAPEAHPAHPDETPATLPTRVLPEGLDEAAARFIEGLNHLHTLTPEPELATSAIRSIMIELKSQPQYIKHVSPDDVRVIVQMMRETMSLTRIVKETKAKSRGGAKKAEVTAAMQELDDMFGDLG